MRRLLLAGFVALAAIYLPVSLLWPMGRDQGIFAWAGDVICRGGVPYRDAFEQKGPATHYTYAAAQWLFGHHPWPVRVFDYLFLAAGAAGAWILAAKWHQDEPKFADPARIGGVTAAILFWLWYGGIGYWSTAQPDGWIAVLQILAVAAVAILPRAGPAAAGFLAGACCLYKPHYGAFVLALLPWAFSHTRSTPRRLRTLGAIIAGFCVPVLFTTAWFWRRGALRDLYECLFAFNWSAHLSGDPSFAGQAIHRLAEFFFSLVPDYWDPRVAPVLPFIIFGFYSLWRNARLWFWTALAWLAFDLVAVVAQGKYFGYHWKPLYAPVAVTAGVGAEFARQWLLRSPRFTRFSAAPARRAAGYFAILVFALPLWRPTQARFTTSAEDLVVKRSWAAYYRRFGGYNSGHFSLRGEIEVADYLKAHTRPDDRVLVWGFDPSINFFADRQTPTRFGFNLPLTRDPPHPCQAAWRSEFISDLQRTPPAYITVVGMDTNELMNKTSRELLSEFPEFNRLLHEHYAPETTIERYELWHRK